MIALIADDLTGASDAGVQFARRGLVTRVLFEWSGAALHADVEALAIDTDTRAEPPSRAYARVRDAAEHVAPTSPDCVYKKVDSTLRGNLGAEIDAVMDAFGFELAIVAPAFPAMGRTTRDGVHLLRGQPVHETEIGRDPKAPVHDSNLVRVVESQSPRPVGLIREAIISRGAGAIRDHVERLAREGVAIAVCDAETADDLEAIARSVAEGRNVLWVGSAGLAESVADTLGSPAHSERADEASADDPILIVAGSLSETTARQIDALGNRAGVLVVEFDPGDAESSTRQACRGLAARNDVAIVTNDRRCDTNVADALGSVAAACVRATPVGGLVLTGGETARAVCRHIGVTGVQLIKEVEPGVPLGRLVGDTSMRLLAVTKAGAFGSEQALVHALEQLKGES